MGGLSSKRTGNLCFSKESPLLGEGLRWGLQLQRAGGKIGEKKKGCPAEEPAPGAGGDGTANPAGPRASRGTNPGAGWPQARLQVKPKPWLCVIPSPPSPPSRFFINSVVF